MKIVSGYKKNYDNINMECYRIDGFKGMDSALKIVESLYDIGMNVERIYVESEHDRDYPEDRFTGLYTNYDELCTGLDQRPPSTIEHINVFGKCNNQDLACTINLFGPNHIVIRTPKESNLDISNTIDEVSHRL